MLGPLLQLLHRVRTVGLAVADFEIPLVNHDARAFQQSNAKSHDQRIVFTDHEKGARGICTADQSIMIPSFGTGKPRSALVNSASAAAPEPPTKGSPVFDPRKEFVGRFQRVRGRILARCCRVSLTNAWLPGIKRTEIAIEYNRQQILHIGRRRGLGAACNVARPDGGTSAGELPLGNESWFAGNDAKHFFLRFDDRRRARKKVGRHGLSDFRRRRHDSNVIQGCAPACDLYPSRAAIAANHDQLIVSRGGERGPKIRFPNPVVRRSHGAIAIAIRTKVWR